jgi:prepilin peptidase CpaA
MNALSFWRVFVISFALAAAYADLRWRKIPRAIMVFGFFSGLAANWYFGHLGSAALAAVAAFALSMFLFSLGAIGGGDVKLITALGAMLGLAPWARAMEISIFAAAAIGVVQMVRKRAVVQTMRNVWEILKSFATFGIRAHPVHNVENEAAIRSPYAVAAAIGVVVAIFAF